MIEPDGAFVAEKPGAYVISASVGDRQALASVIVTPRNAERELEVVGHALINRAKMRTTKQARNRLICLSQPIEVMVRSLS
jgi:hypothetical protein